MADSGSESSEEDFRPEPAQGSDDEREEVPKPASIQEPAQQSDGADNATVQSPEREPIEDAEPREEEEDDRDEGASEEDDDDDEAVSVCMGRGWHHSCRIIVTLGS